MKERFMKIIKNNLLLLILLQIVSSCNHHVIYGRWQLVEEEYIKNGDSVIIKCNDCPTIYFSKKSQNIINDSIINICPRTSFICNNDSLFRYRVEEKEKEMVLSLKSINNPSTYIFIKVH